MQNTPLCMQDAPGKAAGKMPAGQPPRTAVQPILGP